MNRRHFLGAIIASACAPAIVRASSLMPIRERGIWMGRIGRSMTIDHLEDDVMTYLREEIYPMERRFLVSYQFRNWIDLRDAVNPNVVYSAIQFERPPLIVIDDYEEPFRL
jgi:hypothetical protein